MLVKKSLIEEDTLRYFQENFDKSFQYKEGGDLQSVIDEVLHDRNIFTFFALYFEPRQGLELGSTNYWDDITVEEHYGLILDFNTPRRLKLFNYNAVRPSFSKRNIEVYLGYGVHNTEGRLTPETFIQQVNDALRNPKEHLIEFGDRFKTISF